MARIPDADVREQSSNQVGMKEGQSANHPVRDSLRRGRRRNYADGSPKRWWSKLAVVDGRTAKFSRKEIVVNDPLVYQGLRFYQASYGTHWKARQLVLNATPANGSGATQRDFSGDEPDGRA